MWTILHNPWGKELPIMKFSILVIYFVLLNDMKRTLWGELMSALMAKFFFSEITSDIH